MSKNTKDLILESTKALIRNEFRIPSAREIARESGTNLALINYHFKSKSSLIITAITEMTKVAYIKWIDENLNEPLTKESLKKYLKYILSSIYSNCEISVLRINSILQSKEEDWLSIEIFTRLKHIIKIVYNTKNDSLVELEARLIYTNILGLNVLITQPSCANQWISSDEDLDLYAESILKIVNGKESG